MFADAPLLYDFFCCEGGASVGYRRAGFTVVGFDLFKHVNAKGKRVGFSQKRYPFLSWQRDALEVLRNIARGLAPRPAVIHASPPCHHASAGTRAIDRSEYPALIAPVRELLIEIGVPYVIENVEGAELIDPLTLCGTMFGLTAIDTDGTPLELWRHREFESNVPLDAPGPCRHGAYSEQVAGCYGGARSDKVEAREVRGGGYVPKDKAVLEQLMGIDWMTKTGMYQALPPVYTEHLGRQLLAHVREEVAA